MRKRRSRRTKYPDATPAIHTDTKVTVVRRKEGTTSSVTFAIRHFNSQADNHMPQSIRPSIIESRLTELQTDLSSVTDAVRRIEEAITNLQRQADADPAFIQDAENSDRMTDEAGRKRIMESRRAEIEGEIAKLKTSNSASELD